MKTWLLILLSISALGCVFGAEGTKWLYSGADWPDACHSGVKQSPINLYPELCGIESPPDNFVKMVKAIPQGILGTAKGVYITGSGGTLELGWEEWSNEAALDAVAASMGDKAISMYYEYIGTPKNLHFHMVSEHTANGMFYAMEGHMVRQLNTTACGAATCYGVFGIFFKFPVDNATLPVFQDLISYLPPYSENNTKVEDVVLPVDWELEFGDFFPESLDFYAYSGSLTTPGCSEGIAWTVFKQPQTMSVADYETVLTYNAYNIGERTTNRLPQPLNGRQVFCSTKGDVKAVENSFYG